MLIENKRCPKPGNECDHIIPGDDHRIENLQWLCPECHAEKTRLETIARTSSHSE